MVRWRLGVDLGTNSIGIAALTINEENQVSGLLDLGVRIFSDGRNPKDKQSLAAMRRGPRGMRRNRDRALNRNARYLRELQSFGLMPVQSVPPTAAQVEERKLLESLDPYVLRTKGLDEPLKPFELGRALFHLKRRGFKSNRKTDGGDQESGKIRDAARRTQERLNEAGARTLGEWLGRPRIDVIAGNEQRGKGERKPLPQARTRLRGTGANAYYDFYPTREMILGEFDLLWESQKQWNPRLLTDKAYSTLRETLGWQWPLKAPRVGKCRLDPRQERAPRALPSVQRLRIYQELNHLEIQTPGTPWRRITKEERDTLAAKALGQEKLKFDQMRRWLKTPNDARFNLESEKRKHLDGDLTAAKLASDKFWGKQWRELPLATQEGIVSRLLEQENEATLVRWLTEEHGLSEERATAVSLAALPAGHGAFCVEVTRKILTAMESDVITYDKAVVLAGFDSHSMFDDGEVFDSLPYYGKVLERHVAFGTGEPTDPDEKRFGKIANPTVHVALNQLRHVVNDLIRRFGSPSQIVIELARELPLSAQGQRDLERTQKDNQEANDNRRKLLTEHKQSDTYDNRLRLRLWEELNPSSGFPFNVSPFFETFIHDVNPGARFDMFCILIAKRFPKMKSAVVRYDRSEYEALSDELAEAAFDVPPRIIAGKCAEWFSSHGSLANLRSEYESYDFRPENFVVRHLLAHFLAFQDDKVQRPEFFCWPGAWLAGDNLDNDGWMLFEKHGTLFIDKADDDSIFPRIQPGRDEATVHKVFNKFYHHIMTFDLADQWINQTGPFKYDVSWASASTTRDDAEAYLRSQFQIAHDLDPDDVEVL